MPESLLSDRHFGNAISNIKPRSERQRDVAALQRTYVETGVFPQLNNTNNQILYGRRGTGKSHVLRILDLEVASRGNAASLYIDIRTIGSAHLMTDDSQPLVVRCVGVFKDILALIQSELLDIATDPDRDGSGMEEVSELADVIQARTVGVASAEFEDTTQDKVGATSKFGAKVSERPELSAESGRTAERTTGQRVRFTEVYRETVVFAEIATFLNKALTALGIEELFILIDEWTAIPPDVQPYIAEFLKRALFPSNRVVVKIASLEYRSNFTIGVERGNPTGFELGSDISANLDLDDYYVYDRNPDNVVEIFLELLFKHVEAELPAGMLHDNGVDSPVNLRVRLFTERETFVELVRAGEGVVRDFLGIFSQAFFRAQRSGRLKIDRSSVEEAARDWYETDKSTTLSPDLRKALDTIVTDVIGTRQTTMFMLAREHSDNPVIQSLFDQRLIHLISRGYSDKENPGLRYNIYSLDYGTYVDLKRTRAEPDRFEIFDEDTDDDAKDRVVPFADKRSIRRVILTPTALT
ncbi:hypothetical protein [Micromonospora parva]|uniref:ORC-CDC6 family AAA ATPase n=1 Tax=Micromonospora parva TaxID=1464048 RepID=UPI0012DE6485|nr:hypothetical protein [Micromonospora parva]